MEDSILIDRAASKKYIFFVAKDSPAFEAIKRIIKAPYVPGQIIPVSREELKSLKKDLLAVRLAED